MLIIKSDTNKIAIVFILIKSASVETIGPYKRIRLEATASEPSEALDDLVGNLAGARRARHEPLGFLSDSRLRN